MKKVFMSAAFALAIIAAVATNSKSYAKPSGKQRFNITAYRVSDCTTTASVNCSQGAQSCQFNFGSGAEDVKLKDNDLNCTVTLAQN